ncbi:MAG: hypothetical protein AAB512_00535 [Patescibacteria group bacterium]
MSHNKEGMFSGSTKPDVNSENGQTLGGVAAVIGVAFVAPICLAAVVAFNPFVDRQNRLDKVQPGVTPVLGVTTPISPGID